MHILSEVEHNEYRKYNLYSYAGREVHIIKNRVLFLTTTGAGTVANVDCISCMSRCGISTGDHVMLKRHVHVIRTPACQRQTGQRDEMQLHTARVRLQLYR